MKAPKKPFIAIAALAACCAASAAVINVPADVGTIQGAIDAALDGDVIQVAPGTYTGSIDFKGKTIRLIGVQGAAATILDGGGAGSVVQFFRGESGGTVLQGFTVRNGNGGFGGGGGVLVASSSPTIVDNVITGNVACSGAGISVSFGSPLIQGNVISGNSQAGCSGGTGGGGIALLGAGSASVRGNLIERNSVTSADGGGIALFAAGTPDIIDNTIRNNTASGAGGGVSLVNDSNARMVNNLIVGNQAGKGGGVAALVPSGATGLALVNNTIADNRASQGTQVFLEGFPGGAQFSNNIVAGTGSTVAMECSPLFSSESPVLQHNDVYNAGGAAASGPCTGPLAGNFNLSVDPLFVRQPASRRYQLQAGSPVIDAGNNAAISFTTTDLAGKPRVVDGNGDRRAVVDMGAYEAPRRR